MDKKNRLLRYPFCGGKAQVSNPSFTHCVVVMCGKCGVRTPYMNSEAEAIKAWNLRVDDHFLDATKMVERTAKVQILPRRSETSMSWEGKCSNCGAYTIHEMNYCFECGARLEWE